MADALANISTRRTPQNEQADPREVPNNAGGYVFKAADEAIIHRFLTMGTEGGTYYQTEKALTRENATRVLAAACDNGTWLVERILEVSLAGRAPKQNPAIFALAAVAGLGDDAARAAAFAALSKVCRIGTHLFLFLTYVQNFRGWGRGLRTAVAGWYTDKDLDALAYQVVKYRSREGWTHRDAMRRAHPVKEGFNPLFKWVTAGEFSDLLPGLVKAHIEVMASEDPAVWLKAIEDHPMSWEMFPDIAMKDGRVWAALIEKGMPPTALMRNLPRFTNLEILKGSTLKAVTDSLVDEAKLRKGRVHPVSVLLAMKTYASGVSLRGSSTWTPKRQVVDALDASFYAAFGAVEPTGKRRLLALDVSGSMGSRILDSSLTCREASAALALVTMSVESDCTLVGFTSGARGGQTWATFRQDTQLAELAISPRQRLDDAVKAISGLPFGGTDCSLPMVWARAKGLEFDTIEIYTDNETWAGAVHPMQALREYRNASGINTRLAVVALTPTEFTIADPMDVGTLDVSGFDSNVPNLLGDFARGTV